MHPILGKRRHTLVNVRLILGLHEVSHQDPEPFYIFALSHKQLSKSQMAAGFPDIVSGFQAAGRRTGGFPRPLCLPPVKVPTHTVLLFTSHQQALASQGRRALRRRLGTTLLIQILLLGTKCERTSGGNWQYVQ